MGKVIIAYASMTGNTEAMANLIAEGVKAANGEAVVCEAGSVNVDDLKAAKAFALGSPAMGDEVVEESEMQPLSDSVCEFASGKTIALFGSYGWGDGQWMRDWTETLKNAGAEIIGGTDAICQDAPDDAAEKALKELGEKLAELVK